MSTREQENKVKPGKFGKLDEVRYNDGGRLITTRQWLDSIIDKGYTELVEVPRGRFTDWDLMNPVKGDGYRIRRKLEAEYIRYNLEQRAVPVEQKQSKPTPAVQRDGYRLTLTDNYGVLFSGVAEQVTDQGYTWFEIYPRSDAKQIAETLRSEGYDVHNWEEGTVSFDWPHVEPDGTCPYMLENILAQQAKGNDRLYTDMLRDSMVPDEWVVSERTRIYGALKRIEENSQPVRFTEEQAEALKVSIREAAGVTLNTGFLARKFAQIAADVDAENA